MTKTIAAHKAAPSIVTSSTPSTVIVDLDDSFLQVIAELAEVSLARKEAENREKELKALLMGEVPDVSEHGDGVTYAFRTEAGGLRGKVTKRSRTNIDSKTLREVFAEAYSAVASQSEYQVLSI